MASGAKTKAATIDWEPHCLLQYQHSRAKNKPLEVVSIHTNPIQSWHADAKTLSPKTYKPQLQRHSSHIRRSISQNLGLLQAG